MKEFHPFEELTEMINQAFTYTPMTDEQYQASCLKDVIEWASIISGEWNGKLSGRQEDRAHQANEIIEKLHEVKELIEGMQEI